MPSPRPSVLQEAVNLTEVPRGKWQRMVLRTLIGAVFVALGVVGAARWQWPVAWVVGLVVVGCTTWSSQLVLGVVKNLLPVLAAVADIIRGTRRDGAP